MSTSAESSRSGVYSYIIDMVAFVHDYKVIAGRKGCFPIVYACWLGVWNFWCLARDPTVVNFNRRIVCASMHRYNDVKMSASRTNDAKIRKQKYHFPEFAGKKCYHALFYLTSLKYKGAM